MFDSLCCPTTELMLRFATDSSVLAKGRGDALTCLCL